MIGKNYEKILQELKTHQIELELQNEELRRTREELEKSRSKYLDLYDFAPVGYFTLSVDGKILEANHTVAHLLGAKRHQLLKKSFSKFVLPEFQDVFYLHRKNLIQSGTQQSCELKLLKQGSEPFYVHIESMLINDCQEKSNLIRMSILDINDKIRAADALRETASKKELLLNLLSLPAMFIDKDRKILSANHLAQINGARVGGYWLFDFSRGRCETAVNVRPQKIQSNGSFVKGIFCLIDGERDQQQLVTIVEDSSDAVTVFDLKGNIIAWNRTSEEIYGYSASEALKMTIFDLTPSGLENETMNLLNDINSGLPVKPFETRRLAKNGNTVDVRLNVARLIHNKKAAAFVVTERDVSEYNRWLTSVKELPQRIILAQEEERRRISQEIHSDLGQSLLSLKMLISLSASELAEDDSHLNNLFELFKIHLSSIINKARNLSHELAPPSLKYIGLVEAIKKLIGCAKYDKNLKIQFFHRNIGVLNSESRDIIVYRIIQESLNNIFKHAQATKVRIKAIYHNSVFSLEICDNGKGFDYSCKKRSGGLGLDLMKEQVMLICGNLNIESKPGKGTRIRITIPINEEN
ncbi:MAG: PAS domain S-box protein [Candidatus Riflebacteria bacterium]|nr:PAS domain S-box protein [Candidatus Riflebacteria bacterium]